MKHLNQLEQDDIVRKNQHLENIRLQLKLEFVGIDEPIDKIIDMSRAWFIFPEFQQKPTIINLWGMTGVGKTSLVNRFAKLLGLDKRLIPFDLGESASDKWSFERETKELIKHKGNDQFILLFDEFQHAKTIKDGEEIDRPSSRIVWEIIDTGKYKIVDIDSDAWNLGKIILLLDECIKGGVQSKMGIVTRGKEKYRAIFQEQEYRRTRWNRQTISVDKSKKPIPFVPTELDRTLKVLFPERFLTDNKIHETLSTLNEIESVTLLRELYDEACRPKVYDFSKALIFVLGNLDEAYFMSGDLSVDTTADAFYESTKRITITNIKNSLKRRFRSEQISRLGNNHIIYPSLNTGAFKSLINHTLEIIATRYYEKTHIRFQFSESLREIIYMEGVYPTQGARPVLSTINNVIEAKIPQIITSILLNGVECDIVNLSYEKDSIRVDCLKSGKKVYSFEQTIELALERLRKPKRNDKQTVVAVHESGHAVVYVSLFHKLPERIVSVTADQNLGGFILTKNTKGLITATDTLNEIAMLLAGYAAEIMLFGKENLTWGVQTDFKEATQKACEMVKKLGMGSQIGVIQVANKETNDFLHTDVNDEVQKILSRGLKIANGILEQEKHLLLRLADHLSDDAVLEKDEFAKFVTAYSNITFYTEDAVFHTTYFREHLKKMVVELDNIKLKSA